MVKLVKCSICGKVKKTHAKEFFKCCNRAQKITSENWINKSEVDEIPTETKEVEELEIEEEKEFNNPLEQIKEEIFYCPNCNTQLNAYETPCPNCNYIIEWR